MYSNDAEQTLSARGLRCHIRNLPLTYMGAVVEAAKRPWYDPLPSYASVFSSPHQTPMLMHQHGAYGMAPWRGSLTHSACCTRTPADPQGNIILAVAENRLTRYRLVATLGTFSRMRSVSWNTSRHLAWSDVCADTDSDVLHPRLLSAASQPLPSVLGAPCEQLASPCSTACPRNFFAARSPAGWVCMTKPSVSACRTLSATPTRGAHPGCARLLRATWSLLCSRRAQLAWNTLAAATP